MSCREQQDLFDEYLDGELSPEGRARLENHLASCGRCRGELEGLQRLLRDVRQLPDERQPARDLWPDISRRLQPARPVAGGGWLLRLAAVLALLVLSVPLSVRWTQRTERTGQPLSQAAATQPEPSVLASLARAEDGTLLARKDLVIAIERRRDLFGPETLSVLEANKDLLDQAIGELRSALDQDPHNLRLRMFLATRYQQERKLLQKISRV